MAYSGPSNSLTPEQIRQKRTERFCANEQVAGSRTLEIDGELPSAAPTRPPAHSMAVSGQRLGRDPRHLLQDTAAWQFYLDYLASKLSADISEVAVYLGLETAKFDEIKNRCKSNRHEMCFNVLWAWYMRTVKNEDRLKEIKYALKESNRVDLSDELTEGNFPLQENFRFDGEINNSQNKLSGSDAIKVSKQLPLTFQRLARYFGLDENNIQRVCADNTGDVQEQSYRTIDLCIQQQKLTNRRQLCDGLAYIEQYTTISDLQKNW